MIHSVTQNLSTLQKYITISEIPKLEVLIERVSCKDNLADPSTQCLLGNVFTKHAVDMSLKEMHFL